MSRRPDTRLAFWCGGALLFLLLATANGAGYRYSASDQAFYVPAVLRALDPAAFPRDAAMLDVQRRLMVLDEALAALRRLTGVRLEILFLGGYILSLVLLWIAVVLLGQRIYRHWWATAALGVALTLRHRIPRTSANSLEPYFHPRMLAFAVGMLAVAALVRRRFWLAVWLVALAALVHVTTGLWFAVLVGVALALLDRSMRRLAAWGLAALTAVAAGVLASGRAQGAAAPMDDLWLMAVANKDSLFATAWPAWAWAANFAVLGLLWGAHTWRRRRGRATPQDAALVWGGTALVGLFLLTLPLVHARLALPVQLQISRVFWLVDALATVYAVGVVADTPWASPRRAAAIAAGLLAISFARGAYIMFVEQPARALFAVTVADSPWQDTMRWIARQPRGIHVLADPGHAWKYGTSVRASGERDVLLEEVKDSALAIYSRDIAVRVVERTAAIGDFSALTEDHAEALAHRYQLDYLVSDAELALPVAYRNEQFRVYALPR